jgi:diguanylate cyclase (GGDEF)-like protein/PAS domain S-box-containing protein
MKILTHKPGRWLGTLKVRLMLASALVIAASVAVSTEVVLQRVQARSMQAVMELERDNTERMAAMLAQRVVGLQKVLRATAAIMPGAARRETPAAVEFLSDKPGMITSFANVYIANAEGQMLALHDGDSAASRTLILTDREYFRRTVSQGVPVVSAPVAGRISMEPVIQLTMPVLGEGGSVDAVLGGVLRLGTRNLFDDLTYAGHSGTDAATTIVTDAHGIIISHPDRSHIMRPIEAEAGLADVVARWVAQGRPVEPSGFATHEPGRFVTMAGVAGADWMVFHLAPDSELLGGLQQAHRESIQWAGGVALLGSLIILGLLAVLLGPLSQLRRRALALQQGKLAIHEGWPNPHGEIGELSRVLQQVLHERAAVEDAQRTLAHQMSSMLAAAPVGIAFSRARSFEFVGAEFCAMLGWQAQELAGRPAQDIFASAEEYEALIPAVLTAFAAGRPYFGELQFVRRNGTIFWGRLQGRPVEPDNTEGGTIWLLEDITEHRHARERLSWSASHDALTGLLNRSAFEARLQAWLHDPAASEVPPVPASLVFIDLDRFKQINDSAGHAAGDEVLRQVGAVLRAQLRAGDVVARMGGDEFALLLPGCVVAVALQLAERLRQAISEVGVDQAAGRLTVGASVGVIEIQPAVSTVVAEWMARVDAACYEAKRDGRGVVRVAGTALPLRMVSE